MQYVTGPSASNTLKGPYHLGASLAFGYWSLRFFPSSQTWLPFEKVGKVEPCLLCASFIAWSTMVWLALMSSLIFWICSRRFTASGVDMVVRRMVKWGLYPMRTSNGDFHVVPWIWLL